MKLFSALVTTVLSLSSAFAVSPVFAQGGGSCITKNDCLTLEFEQECWETFEGCTREEYTHEVRRMDSYAQYFLSSKGVHLSVVEKNKKGMKPVLFNISGESYQTLFFPAGSCIAVKFSSDEEIHDPGYANFSIPAITSNELHLFLNGQEVPERDKPIYQVGCTDSSQSPDPDHGFSQNITVSNWFYGKTEVLVFQDTYLHGEISAGKFFNDNQRYVFFSDELK